jgi:NodT family efflux transporter outer membrane factor (OMF) lipoprotein
MLLLSGCFSVGPNYKTPDTKAPAQWTSLSLAPNATNGTESIASNSTTFASANTTIEGNTTEPDNATAEGNTTAAGNDTTADNTAGGNLTAPDNTTNESNVTTEGNSTATDNTTAADNTTIGNNSTAEGNTTAEGNATAAGAPPAHGKFMAEVNSLSLGNNSTENSLVAPSPITTTAWWTTFNDDELNTLIKEAAAQNLTVLQALAAVREAKATLGVTGALAWPTVNGTGDYTYGGNNGDATRTNAWGTGVNAAWNLDIWGGIRRQIESAEASLQAALENRDDALVTIEAQIGTTYLDLRTNQYLLQIAHTNLDIQNHTVKITQQRFDGGFVSKLDVENALAQADNTRAQIPSFESAARVDIYLLAVLLGKEPGALVAELDPPGPMLKAPAQIPIGIPSELLRRRADIRAAESNLHASTANIGAEEAQLFPQFSILSGLNFQASNLGQLFKWSSASWTVGPTVNWQIFAAGGIIASIHFQEAAQLNAFFVYKSTVLTAFQQVESALTQFEKEQVRRAALIDSVTDNQKATDLSMELYKEGDTEFLNVLTAESGLYGSQQQLALSEQAISNDLISLYQALGGGWSEFPIQSAEVPVPYPVYPYAPPPPIPPPPHSK